MRPPQSNVTPSNTPRRPDSCVSLRPYLHDTQLPYPTSCYTPSFGQRCKGRTPTPAGHVSDSVGSALILRPWGSAPTRRASGSTLEPQTPCTRSACPQSRPVRAAAPTPSWAMPKPFQCCRPENSIRSAHKKGQSCSCLSSKAVPSTEQQ